ncbi:MAG: polymorphic toxin-type HINT domain-containing protein [Candidatus Sphingomonas phytovorans]|nr:polymorphic toxin-type HINT domain-containing protein [Sphingomonas sp.]WEJ98137.1 MAG: polymorphic toxin-type HINT domain-containing protein [Sphingomonas sp.]
MAGIFTGLGTGFERGSAMTLGSRGLLGQSSLGRGGDSVFVNAANGNLMISRQDEFLVGRGPDIAISRTYNSQATLPDDNNDKWRQSTDRRVFDFNSAAGTVHRVSADGSDITYTYNGTAYVTTDGSGAYDQIVKVGNEWIWTDGDTQQVEKYDDLNGGRITWQGDTDGNAITYTYVGSTTKLDKATTADGAWTQYSWVGNDISKIVTGYTDLQTGTAKTLTRTWYEYTSGRLTKVRTDLTPDDNTLPTDAQSYWTAYGYDANGRINSVSQKDGSLLSILYDASGRVSSLTETPASGVTRVTTLTYNSTTKTTSILDASGQTTELTYDAAGNLTRIKAPPASAGAAQQIVQFGYDAATGDLTSVTDAFGNTSTYTYVGGNLTSATDRLNNVVTRTYGSKNQLLTETHTATDASGAAVSITTRYAYDAENHLRYAVSGEGYVTEYRYTPAGELQYSFEFPEHPYTIGSTAVTEAAMDSWRAAIADKQSIKITYYASDARGALTGTTRYGYATTAGAASMNESYSESFVTYDQAGRLLKRNAGGQAVETFVYDGMGRLTASTDVNGGTTSFVFDDAQTTTTVTLASGYVTTNTYNKSGDLISQTDSGSAVTGGTTSYAYDKLGRLRVATDAVGSKTFHIYDKAGRKVAEANAYGDVVEYIYDAGNRLVGTWRHGARLTAAQMTTLSDPNAVFDFSSMRPADHANDVRSWTVYDKEGNVLAAIAGDGSVTAYGYDKAGNLVSTIGYFNKLTAAQITAYKVTPPSVVTTPTADARDSIARTFYDRDGRLLGTLDGEGYLSRVIYDKAGQKVEDVSFANATAVAQRAAGSFNDLLSSVTVSADDRRVRYVYDGQGLLRYALDGLNQATSYSYNIAGQQTSWTRFAVAMGATADYTYDNVKALLAGQVSNAANRTTWSVYDAAGRLAYGIDADGGVTGFGYDTMGQVVRAVQYATRRATPSLPLLSDMTSFNTTNIGNADNRITRTWYTARGEARFTVDPEGYVTASEFNAIGQTVAVKSWDAKIAVSDATTLAQVQALATGTYTGRTYTYHPNGNVFMEYDAYGVATLYDYLANGLLNARYDAYNTPDQALTAYNYDATGRLISEVRGVGTPEVSAVGFAYDGLGNRISMIDARAITTTYTFDKVGQLKTQTDALGGVSAFEYNAFGEVWKTTDPRGAVSCNWYDSLGRMTHARDAENYLTKTSYNVFGEVASVTRYFNPVAGTAAIGTPPSVAANAVEDATTSFAYDKLGRVLTSTDALGFYASYSYNAFGDRISATAKSATGSVAAGAVTNYSFDRRGLMLSETLPMATYDNAGNVVSATIVNRFEYDARGNRTKLVEADNLSYKRTTLYIYDKSDRLIETRGDQVSVIGDDLVTVTTPAAPNEQIKYDGRGNIIETIDAGGARTLLYYDDLNRKTVEIRQTSASGNTYSTYAYDANGNVTLTRVYAGSIALPATVTATPPGVPSGGYRETSFTYDNLNRLSTSQVSNVVVGTQATGYAAANLVTTYVYDANGNVVKVTDPNGGITYSYYDKLGRKLAKVDAEKALTTWTYDPDGNVVAEMRFANRINTQSGSPVTLDQNAAVSGLVASAGYNDDDRYTTFTYDRNGNRLSETRYSLREVLVSGAATTTAGFSTATISYLYNGLGQVIRKTEATGDQTNYLYDGAGRLSTETRAAFVDFNGQSVSPTTQYLYDGLGNLSRTVQSGATGAAARVTTYSYGAGGRLSSMTDASGFTRSYAYDIMGRVKKESYTRATAAGGTVTDAIATRYDLAGRTIYQGVAKLDGAGFTVVDYSETQYNNFGDVWKQGAHGVWQSENLYDNAGRLTATNAGDGVWKFFGYDRNGNQTVAITSAGTSLAGQSFTGALSLIPQATVNATYTLYDKRNMAVQVKEEGRQLNAAGGAVNELNTYRTYNAFGDVASETNAIGATLTYSYNNMGRLVKTESPYVNVTLENGTTSSLRPTEYYYYDLSGRLTGSRDANGNLLRRSLLAGTGYGGGEALVVATVAADGGTATTSYDIHGDARRLTDQVGRVTTQDYDAMGRAIQVSRAGGLVENYAYDGLGQRIQAWNNQFQTPIYGPTEEYWVEDYDPYYGYYTGQGHYEYYTPIIGYTPEKALTEYDSSGRVISQLAFGGDLTTVGYVWNAGIGTAVGTTGGWVQTTTYVNGKTSVETSDVFGRTTAKTDLGGHAWTYTYDVSGRMTQTSMGGLSTYFSYFNTGQLAQTVVGTLTPQVNTNWSRTVAVYGYDQLGQRVREQQSEEAGYYTEGHYEYYGDPYDPWGNYGEYWVDESYYATAATLTDVTVGYDSLGRMTTFQEAGTTYSPAANISYSYDANGNVRRTTATYRMLDRHGVASGPVTSDYWFRYDALNRLVTDKGTLRGGQIVRGEAGGQDILYNAAGDRVAILKTEYGAGYYDYEYGYYNPGYYYENRETYLYDGAGRLSEVQVSTGGVVYEEYDYYTGLTTPPASVPAAPVAGTRRSSFGYDLMGRQISQSDYDYNGTTVIYSRTAGYNNKGQLTSDSTSTKKYDGYTYQSITTYDYGYGTNYALGSVVSSYSRNYRNWNDGQAPDTSTVNTYQWWDGAVQSSISFKPNTSQSTTYTTGFYYNGFGQLSSIYVSDGRARSITFKTNAEGQIIRRDEEDWRAQGNPHEIWYRFNGRQLGYTGNNGTSDVTTTTSIAERQQVSPSSPGAFRGGYNYGVSYADFANSYDPINSYSQGSAGGSYTVRAGDSLSSIAQSLWGDSSLWYKIAQANGMSGAGGLVEGQTLTLPTGVIKSTNNANTFKPYDPSEAIGDVSPTTPRPAAPKKNKCGVFGMVLLAVVAIAVAAWVGPGAVGFFQGLLAGGGTVVAGSAAAIGGAILGGAVAGAAGSIVSQAVGLATGIQEKFSWKGVALAALGGAVGGGIGEFAKGATEAAKLGKTLSSLGKFGKLLGGNGFVSGVARGVLSSGLTQGIAVATGLQSKFDFAAVAAAGIGGGVSNLVGGDLPGFDTSKGGNNSIGNYLSHLGANAAGALANAATRSVVSGTDFGDNLIAALPDVIGQTIGNMLVHGIVGSPAISNSDGMASIRGACFVLGTPVHTPRGLIAIEEIKVGDWVFARDEANRSEGVHRRQVLELYRFEQEKVLTVTLLDANGITHEILATIEHPFFRNGLWVAAVDLQPGDELVAIDGSALTVQSVGGTHPVPLVCNFAVDQDHTYFVGDIGAWVHNQSTPPGSVVVANCPAGAQGCRETVVVHVDTIEQARAGRATYAAAAAANPAPNDAANLRDWDNFIDSMVAGQKPPPAPPVEKVQEAPREQTSNTGPGAGSAVAGAGWGLDAAGRRILTENPRLVVQWDFYLSAVTQRGGPSGPLADRLRAAGITVNTQNVVPPGSSGRGSGGTIQSINQANGLAGERYSEASARSRGFTFDGRQIDINGNGSRIVDSQFSRQSWWHPRNNVTLQVETKVGYRTNGSEIGRQINFDAGRIVANGYVRRAGVVVDVLGRVARPVGWAMDAAEIYGAYRDDGGRFGVRTQRASAGVAGGTIGGAGGAWAGAALGAAIGSVVPGVGTVVGGIVGGVIGGIAGGIGGDVGARATYDALR